MKLFSKIFCISAILSVFISPAFAQKQDAEILLPKPDMLFIVNYETNNNDPYVFPIGQLVGNDMGAIYALRGKVTRMLYKAPAAKSTLEIYDYYKALLPEKGFNILYEEQGEKLGSWRYIFYRHNPMLFGNGKDQCYISAKLSAKDTSIYIAIYITKGFYQYPIASIDVIETVSDETPEDVYPLPLNRTTEKILPLPKPAMMQNKNK
jgi:hypothetical protein